jgi:cysteine desulfurase
MRRPIYLDYNATTPVDERVVEAMIPYFTESFGNAASVDHYYGHEAQQAVQKAREDVARLISAAPEEIIFTSGATEANNIAILGTLARAGEDAELVISAIEHPAVLEPAARLGARLRIVPVSADGTVDPREVERQITPKTALVSVMAANNETGAIQSIAEIGRICADAEVPFHSDAVQAAARFTLDVDQAQVSLLSLSAHKLYGPKGIGALFVRRRGRRMKVAPLQYGGGHERNLRPGTANVPAIVGFGMAACLARDELPAASEREGLMKQRLVAALLGLDGVSANTPLDESLPQTLNVRIDGVGSNALMRQTRDELAFSGGSACATTKTEPSHVLLAQGLSAQQAAESIRLSFGRFTSDDEIAQTAAILTEATKVLRAISRHRAA